MKKAFNKFRKPLLAYKRLRDAIFSQRWIRFGVIGTAATVSYFALGILFVDLLHMPVLIGNGLAYIISFAVSYAGQSRWTFRARDSDTRMLPKFAIAQAIGFCLNSFIIGVAVKWGFSYIISMLLAVAIVPVVVYFICKFWVFKRREENEQS